MLTLGANQQTAGPLSQTRHDSVISPRHLRLPPERFVSSSHGTPQGLSPTYSIQGMSNPHRGIPPSSISESVRQQQPPPPIHGYAPIQPQTAYTTARTVEEEYETYYAAKIEEHKRYREEERTRQQQLKLEQRKIEHDMLRECLAGGVPPHLIPALFASLDGARMSGSSPVAQYHATQPEYPPVGHPSRGSPPELRRETRAIPQQQPVYYAPPGSAIPHPATLAQQPPPPVYHPGPVVQSPRGPRAGVFSHSQSGASALRHPVSSGLPRLSTNEPQAPPPAVAAAAAAYAPERASPSPSISFHHWQPPTTSTSARAGPAETKTSPRHIGPSSAESAAVNSPRKRKDTRPHQAAAAPPPSSSSTSQYIARERSPMSERPVSAHGRPPQHARHSSAGQFRARAYDPVRAQSQAQNRRSTPDAPPEFRRPHTAAGDPGGHDMPGSKTEPSPR